MSKNKTSILEYLPVFFNKIGQEQKKVCLIVIVAIPLIYVIIHLFGKENNFSSSLDQANEAIKYISETVKWFITIQAGILGFIGNLILKVKSTDKKTELINQFFIPVSFWCMSILCGAWVLTGLPSILLRLEDPEYCKGFDVLIMPIYSWLFDILNLSLFYSLVHWYWAFGILSFGYVFIWKKT